MDIYSLKTHFNEDVSVPVPGGDKENPNATIKDKNELSIPGGDKEAPGTAAIELSAEEYNSALSTLKKSFKEGYGILELLEHSVVSINSTDDLQDEFTENAIFESYINGPYFEKVNNVDKKEIKKIISDITKKSKTRKKKDKYEYGFKVYPSRTHDIAKNALNNGIAGGIYGALTVGPISGIVMTLLTALIGTVAASAFNTKNMMGILLKIKSFKNHLWQMLGQIALVDDQSLDDARKYLEDQFKDFISDKFTFNFIKIKYNNSPTISSTTYIVIVDSKSNSVNKEIDTITIDANDIKKENKAE